LLIIEVGKLDPAVEIPRNFTFENSISKLDGEEKRMFLAFVKRMLTWQPEYRSTAKDLLDDPWLHT
jgi:serine/threonine-protein kinase SRPK3